MDIHAVFDGLAWITAAAATLLLRRYFADAFPTARRPSAGYIAAMLIGAAVGAYALGTLNIWLAGLTGLSRSIEGALAGAILAVELYKWKNGITGRTAALFALPVALGIGVGRIGCYLSGLDDFTYGTPTGLPWGHDFGDGVLRYPVQLYETAAMLVFAIGYGVALVRREAWILRNGFALFVLYYGLQRFVWEFLKPYPPVLGGLGVFQIVCVFLVIYGLVMVMPGRRQDAQRA